MKVIKPNDFPSTDGSFTRSTTGTYWSATKVLTTASTNEPRFNYDPDTSQFEGILLEQASTNILLNSTSLSTQTRTVTSGVQYTVSFYGTGSIALSGAYVSTVIGTGAFQLTKLTFTTTTTSLTLTVTGTVSHAQLELGLAATSRIITTGSAVTRAADVVTGTGLIYTSVTDATAVYSSGTTYALGVKVRYVNKIWESLQASNTNHQPDTSPTWWLDSGPDNMHAAFDTTISTVSSTVTQMTFVVKLGAISSAALINVKAATARLAITDPTEGNVYSSIYGLSGSNIFDWYQYFFNDPLVERTQIIYSDIPLYENSLVTIRLDNSTGDAITLAQAIFGKINDLGGTQYGANTGITDFSIKQTDEFGNVSFLQRAFSKKLSAQVYVTKAELNRVQNFLYSIRAKPSVWIASDDPNYEETLIIYGYYRDFSTVISYPSYNLCSLEIEGLT